MTELSFRERVRARHRLAGTFVKTPCHQTVEVLGTTDLDFIVLDAEHAPFSPNALDVSLLAARATQLPALVRIADVQPATVLQALDLGATGLLVPHAKSVQGIREVLATTRYRQGVRGFSNSPRAGGYGTTPMRPLVEAADRDTTVIFQIEDCEAIDDIESLAAMEEVDGFLIGRADLAVSYGVFETAHPDVRAATSRVCQACAATGKTVGLFLSDLNELDDWLSLGVSLFLVGSDQAYLRSQANSMASSIRTAR